MRGLTATHRAARRHQQQVDLDHFFYGLFRQTALHLRDGSSDDARLLLREAELRAHSGADRARGTIVRTAEPAPYFEMLSFAAFVVEDYENLRQIPGRPWPSRTGVTLVPSATEDLGLVLADRLGIAALHRDRPTLARFAVTLVSSTRNAATELERDTARALALVAWGLADGFGGTSTTAAQLAPSLRTANAGLP